MASALAPGAARQRRKEARPQELLDAALSLFVERGFAATRSEEVAQKAGVSKGTLYLYFPSKEELFKAVVRHHLSELIKEGQALADSFEGPTSELLSHLLQAWWQRIGQTPAGGIVKIMIGEVRNFPELAQFYADEVIFPAHRLLEGTLQRGIDRGEFRPVAVHETVHVLVAPSLMMALHRHSIGACPVSGLGLDEGLVVRTQIDLVLRGLLPAVDSPGAAAIAPAAAAIATAAALSAPAATAAGPNTASRKKKP